VHAFTEALEDGECGSSKHQDGEQHDDEGGGAQYLDNLLGSKLGTLIGQIERQGVGYGTTQTWGGWTII
jgi:hypothetical protein